MLVRTLFSVALLAASLLSLPAGANETIRKAVESRIQAKVEQINKTEYGDLYEVIAAGQIFYTDEKASFFLLGTLIDTRNMQNVTGKRIFATLPLELAVKQVRGNGKAVLVTFEDPNCGYCKRLAKDLRNLKDATIYTFMVPILSEDSAEKSKAIWCAADRAKAWNDWMVDGKPPVAGKDCKAPVDKFAELGQRYQVTGTPTLMFADGSRVPGAIPLAQIEQRLAAIGGRK